LKAGSGNNHLIADDIAAGAGMTLNTGPGNNSVSATVSGTGGFAPLTVNGGPGSDSLVVAGDGDNPLVINYPSVTQPDAGKIVASYPPSGPSRPVIYTAISTIIDAQPPPLDATTLVVTPATATLEAGESATFTATVSSAEGIPTDGSVQFLINGTAVGNPVTVSAGIAHDLVAEAAGIYSISAQYTGDGSTYASSAVSASASLSVDAPVIVSSITGISSPTNQPQSNVDVTFSTPIETGSVSVGALTLTDDNSSNLLGSSASLTLVSGTLSTYAIGGLSSQTAAQGRYTLTVNPGDIKGQDGFAGSGSTSVSWLTDTTAPTSHVVNELGTSQTSDTFSVTVSFSDPTGAGGAPPSGVATLELFVSVNNGPFSLSQKMIITPTASGTSTFTFVGQDRNVYAFHSIAIDAAGNTESKNGTTIEASTNVPDLNPPVTHVLAASSSDASGVFTLNWSGTDPDQNTGTPAGSIALVDVYAVVDNGAPQEIEQVPGGTPSALARIFHPLF
jgi:hypothetical protein